MLNVYEANVNETDFEVTSNEDCPMCKKERTVVVDGEIHYCKSCKFLMGNQFYKKNVVGL